MAIKERVTLVVDTKVNLADLERLETRLKKRLKLSIDADSRQLRDMVKDLDGGSVTTDVSASGIAETRRQVAALQRDMASMTLANRIDHSPLFALNEHLSLKQKHLREVRADFAQPIIFGGYKDAGGGFSSPAANGPVSGTARSLGADFTLDASGFRSAVRDFDRSVSRMGKDIGTEIKRSMGGGFNPLRTIGSLLGNTIKVGTSVATAPLKMAGGLVNATAGGVARGAIQGFGEQGGKQAFLGLFDDKVFVQTRRLADYTGSVTNAFIDLELGVSKFLSTLLQTGNPKTAAGDSAQYFVKAEMKAPMEKLSKVLSIVQKTSKDEMLQAVREAFPERAELLEKDIGSQIKNLRTARSTINKEIKELEGHLENPNISDTNKGHIKAQIEERKEDLKGVKSTLKGYAVREFTAMIQEIAQEAVGQFGVAYKPLIAEMQPLLRVIQNIQGFTAIDKATKRKEQLVAEFPTNNPDSLLTIGGAQGARGQGARQVSEWLRPFFGDRNIIPIENPDTDGVTESTVLKKLLTTFAPDLAKNPAFGETINNVENMVLGSLNPMLRSVAVIESLAQIMAAKEVNPDAEVGVVSYSLGGVEALKLAAALDLMGVEVRDGVKILASAFPHLQLLDKEYSTLTTAVLDVDPVAAPYFTGVAQETDRARLLKDSKLSAGAGADAHGFHHLLRSPEFRGLLEGMGGKFSSDAPQNTAKELSDIYNIIGSLGQVRSMLETGEYDMTLPTKGFGGDDSPFREFMEGIGKVLNKNTNNLEPEAKATITALQAEARALLPMLVDKLRADGIQVDTKGKSDVEVAHSIDAMFQAENFNNFLDMMRGVGEEGTVGWAPKNIQSVEDLPSIVKPLEEYTKWAGKQNFTGDMASMVDTINSILEAAKDQIESGEFNRKALLGEAKKRPVYEQFKGDFYQKRLNTDDLPGIEDIRALPEGTEQFATDMPEAIPAFNRLADALGDLMPAAQQIERAAAGMSGAVTLLTKDFAYKTDTDPDKIASPQERAAYERLQGRFSPLMAVGEEGRALVTERIQGGPVKSLMNALAAPAQKLRDELKGDPKKWEAAGDDLREATAALKDAATPYEKNKAQKKIDDANQTLGLEGRLQVARDDLRIGKDELKQARTPDEKNAAQLKINDAQAKVKLLGTLVSESRSELRSLKKEFNEQAEELYVYVGRLGAAMQELGVAHNDLAGANVFIEGMTDVQGAADTIRQRYAEIQSLRRELREEEDPGRQEELRGQLQQRQKEGVFSELDLENKITSIDLGNTRIAKPGEQVDTDKLTTQFRSVMDITFWGIMNNLKMVQAIAQGYNNPLPEREARQFPQEIDYDKVDYSLMDEYGAFPKDYDFPMKPGGAPTFDEPGTAFELGAERQLSPADAVLPQKSISEAAKQLKVVGESLQDLVSEVKAQAAESIAAVKAVSDIVGDTMSEVGENLKGKSDEGRSQRINNKTKLEEAEAGVFDVINNATGGRVDGEDIRDTVKNAVDGAVASTTVLFTNQWAAGRERQDAVAKGVASVVPMVGQSEAFQNTAAGVVKFTGDWVVGPALFKWALGASGFGEMVAAWEHMTASAETALVTTIEGGLAGEGVGQIAGEVGSALAHGGESKALTVAEHSGGILGHMRDIAASAKQVAVRGAEAVAHPGKALMEKGVHDTTHRMAHDLSHNAPEGLASSKVASDLDTAGGDALARRRNRAQSAVDNIMDSVDDLESVGYNMVSNAIRSAKSFEEVEKILAAKVSSGKMSRKSFASGELGEADQATFMDNITRNKSGFMYADELEELARQVGVDAKTAGAANKKQLARLISRKMVQSGGSTEDLAGLIDELFTKGGVVQSSGLSSKTQGRKADYVLGAAARIEGQTKKAFTAGKWMADDSAVIPDDLLDAVEGLEKALDELLVLKEVLPASGRDRTIDARINSIESTLSRGKVGEAYMTLQDLRSSGLREPRRGPRTPLNPANTAQRSADKARAESKRQAQEQAREIEAQQAQLEAKMAELQQLKDELQQIPPPTTAQDASKAVVPVEESGQSKAMTYYTNQDKSKAYQEATDIGHHLNTGMADGINDSRQLPLDAMAESCEEIIERAKDEFDQHSPSRKFHGVGVNNMAGLAEGTEEGAGQAIDAMKSAADEIGNVQFTSPALVVDKANFTNREIGRDVVAPNTTGEVSPEDYTFISRFRELGDLLNALTTGYKSRVEQRDSNKAFFGEQDVMYATVESSHRNPQGEAAYGPIKVVLDSTALASDTPVTAGDTGRMTHEILPKLHSGVAAIAQLQSKLTEIVPQWDQVGLNADRENRGKPTVPYFEAQISDPSILRDLASYITSVDIPENSATLAALERLIELLPNSQVTVDGKAPNLATHSPIPLPKRGAYRRRSMAERYGLDTRKSEPLPSVDDVLAVGGFDAIKKGEKIGGELNAGVAKGVEDTADLSVDAMVSGCEEVVQAAKDVYQIKSPSKVFTGIGEDNMEGLANGIILGGPGVEKALKALIAKTQGIDLNLLSGAELDQLGAELEDWADTFEALSGSAIDQDALGHLDEYGQQMAQFAQDFTTHLETIKAAAAGAPVNPNLAGLAKQPLAVGVRPENVNSRIGVSGRFVDSAQTAHDNRTSIPVVDAINQGAQNVRDRIVDGASQVEAQDGADTMDSIIRKIREGMEASEGFRNGMRDVGSSILQAAGTLTGGAFDSPELQNLVRQFGLLEKVGVAAFGAIGVAMIGFSLASTQAALEMKQIRIQMKAVGVSAQEFDKLADAATENSLNYRGLVNTTYQLRGALLDTASEDSAGEMAAQIERIGLALQASPEQMERFRVAIQQMAAKGVISMEELRQQAAEAVPQVVGATAQALGVNREELTSVISSGTVSSSKNLPKILDILEKQTEGGLEEAQSSLPAVKNKVDGSLFRIQAEAGKAPLEALTAVASSFADILVAAEPVIKLFATFAGDLTALTVILGGAAVASWALSAGLNGALFSLKALWAAAVAHPFIAIAAAIAAVGYASYKHFSGAKAETEEYTRSLGAANSRLKEQVKQLRIAQKLSEGGYKPTPTRFFRGNDISNNVFTDGKGNSGLNASVRNEQLEERQYLFGENVPGFVKDLRKHFKQEAREFNQTVQEIDNERNIRKSDPLAAATRKKLTKFQDFQADKLPAVDANLDEYTSRYNELEQSINGVRGKLVRLGTGLGDKSGVTRLREQLKELEAQKANLSKDVFGFEGFGIGDIDADIAALEQQIDVIKKGATDKKTGEINLTLKQSELIDDLNTEIDAAVGRKRELEILLNIKAAKFDIDIAGVQGEYEDRMQALEAADVALYEGIVARRLALQTTEEEMALEEANAARDLVDKKIAELDRFNAARLNVLRNNSEFGDAEALLGDFGAASAESATNSQIDQAIAHAEANPSAFESQKKLLGVLKELKQAQTERLGLQREGAQAALAQAQAERQYLGSLRNVLSVLDQINAVKDAGDQTFDLRRTQVQNRLNAQRVNTPIPLGEVAQTRQDNAFQDELSQSMIALYEEEIDFRQGLIDELVGTANILNRAQRKAASELLGGVDITAASLVRINQALATLANDEALGRPVDNDVRSALQAQQQVIQLEIENANDEGAIIGEQQAIVDRRQQNIHNITERELRDLQQGLADSVRDMMRSFEDIMESLSDQSFSIQQELKRAKLEQAVLKGRNAVLESVKGLESPFVGIFDTVASAVTDIQEVLLDYENKVRESAKLPRVVQRQVEDYKRSNLRNIQGLDDRIFDATGQDQPIAISGQRGEITTQQISDYIAPGFSSGAIGPQSSVITPIESMTINVQGVTPSNLFNQPGGGAELSLPVQQSTPIGGASQPASYSQADLINFVRQQRESGEAARYQREQQRLRQEHLQRVAPRAPQGGGRTPEELVKALGQWGSVRQRNLGSESALYLKDMYDILRREQNSGRGSSELVSAAQEIIRRLSELTSGYTNEEGRRVKGWADSPQYQQFLRNLETATTPQTTTGGTRAVQGSTPLGPLPATAGIVNGADYAPNSGSLAGIGDNYNFQTGIAQRMAADQAIMNAQVDAAAANLLQFNAATVRTAEELKAIKLQNLFLGLKQSLRRQVSEFNKQIREFPLAVRRFKMTLQDFAMQGRPMSLSQRVGRINEETSIREEELIFEARGLQTQGEAIIDAISRGSSEGNALSDILKQTKGQDKTTVDAMNKVLRLVEVDGLEGDVYQRAQDKVSQVTTDPDQALNLKTIISNARRASMVFSDQLAGMMASLDLPDAEKQRLQTIVNTMLKGIEVDPEAIEFARQHIGGFEAGIRRAGKAAREALIEMEVRKGVIATAASIDNTQNGVFDLRDDLELGTSSFAKTRRRGKATKAFLESTEDARRDQYVYDQQSQGSNLTVEELQAQFKIINDLKLDKARKEIDSVGTALKEGFAGILGDTLLSLFKLEDGFEEIGRNILLSMRDLFAQIAAELIKAQIISFATKLIKTFSGGGEVPNKADGGEIVNAADGYSPFAIAAAARREKVLSGGKKPQLIMAHVGEEVLSTRNGDAQLWRKMKETGAYDLIKERRGNMASGGTVGGNATTTAQSMVYSKYPQKSSGSGGTTFNDYSVKIDRVNDYESFRRSKTQIESRQRQQQTQSSRRSIN
jgi:tape measure domain-containing protein